MTALVVQDFLGGNLILGDVHVDEAKVGNHYWNRLPDGTTADLTAGQFLPGEMVVGGTTVHRPPDAPVVTGSSTNSCATGSRTN